jgi:hypothetical protein
VRVVVPNVAQLRKQQLVDRSLATGQVDDECSADSWRDAFVLVELHHVEQVAGMLAIERGAKLAAVNDPPADTIGSSTSASNWLRAAGTK